jgi:2-methylisocitrate lyase-like PEP mutase family enzyme
MIIARTDAASLMGIREAIKRAKAYVAAGADMVFPDAVLSAEDIKRFVESVDAPVSINMGLAIRKRPTTPLVSVKELEELGVARVTFPRMITAAAITGMRNALKIVKESLEKGIIIERPDLVAGFEEITDLMGLSRILNLERQFLPDEVLAEKYR